MAYRRSKMIPEWFSKAKLGIFIHWGIYSIEGVPGGWGFAYPNISYVDYMKYRAKFTARNYDPEKWADIFKRAGAGYAVLTTKHHDGVALWDTKAGGLSVVKDTPAGRDLIGPYCRAMRGAGIKTGLYYSHPDWSVDEYLSAVCDRPVEEIRELRKKKTAFVEMWHEVSKRPEGGLRVTPEKLKVWETFLKLYSAQIEELANYAPDVFWGDGMLELPGFDWPKRRVRELLKSANPDAVISRLPGYEDIKTPEVRMPCKPPDSGPWEYCTTINDHWEYKAEDRNFKSPAQIRRIFCDILTMGGNLLLDVGPREDGVIIPEEEEALLALGTFIEKNREAIYDTERGLDWQYYRDGSVLTADRKTLYLFVHDEPRDGIMVRGIDTPIKEIRVVSTGEKLREQYFFSRGYGCFWIHLKPGMTDRNMTTVVKVTFQEPIMVKDNWGMLWENDPTLEINKKT
jgi:alpha-L-fucosidase